MVKLTESIIVGRTKVSALENVRKLNCWGCDLDDIEILQQMPNVEVLSLSVNNIESLWPLAGCTNLRELYLRKNNILDIRELRHLRRLSKLRILWLSENPFAEDPDYRYYALNVLPNLTTLDNRPVTAEELNAMSAYFDRSPETGSQSEDQQQQQNQRRMAEESAGAFSSPECDRPPPPDSSSFAPMQNNGGGLGYKTVRLVDQRQISSTSSTSGPVRGSTMQMHDSIHRGSEDYPNSAAMTASCYVKSESNGYGSAYDRRQSSTSMTSLHETVAPEMVNTQQQRSNSSAMRAGSTSSNSSQNVLSAISALLNELDRRGLEMVINEAEQRLRRL